MMYYVAVYNLSMIVCIQNFILQSNEEQYSISVFIIVNTLLCVAIHGCNADMNCLIINCTW